MQKQDIIQIDYTTCGDNYQFKLPLNIDEAYLLRIKIIKKNNKKLNTLSFKRAAEFISVVCSICI
ncbi:TPA: hypothetical protein RQA65_000563 [Clostridioides difficile]|nr:hypothetical protein [Clostridioides difficile]